MSDCTRIMDAVKAMISEIGTSIDDLGQSKMCKLEAETKNEESGARLFSIQSFTPEPVGMLNFVQEVDQFSTSIASVESGLNGSGHISLHRL